MKSLQVTVGINKAGETVGEVHVAKMQLKSTGKACLAYQTLSIEQIFLTPHVLLISHIRKKSSESTSPKYGLASAVF